MKSQAKKNIIAALILANLLAYIPVTFALQAPGCTELNKPEDLKGWIVTILEEQISTEKNKMDDVNQTVSRDCLRVSKPCPDGSKTKSKDKEGAPEQCTDYQDLETGCTDGQACNRVQVIFSKSGTGLLYYYIGMIYRWAAGTIGMVCVLFLVIGGLKITTSADGSGVEEGKTKIIQSIGGLVLLFLSGLILYTINPNFFTQ